MKKGTIEALREATKTLFSEKFISITGSSFLLTTLVVFTALWLFIGVILVSGSFLSLLFSSLLISSILVFLHGWYAIIIPVRSIDTHKKMHLKEDFLLFREYITIYLSYISWYSLILICLILGFLFFLILLSALHEALWWIWLLSWIAIFVYWHTRMYFSWYHMFSEGSLSWKTFRESIRITKKKIVSIFFSVLFFSLVIWSIASLLELWFWSFFSLIWVDIVFGELIRATMIVNNDLPLLMQVLGKIFEENITLIGVTSLLFSVFYSLSAVLSRAMFHIFSVQYYLRLREIHESESSFLRPLLMKNAQKN